MRLITGGIDHPCECDPVACLQVENLVSKGFSFSLKDGMSLAGGGSLPTQEIPTVLLAVNSERISSGRLEKKLRLLDVPIIARIYEDETLFDLRTIDEDEFELIEAGLKSISEDL